MLSSTSAGFLFSCEFVVGWLK